ncbi:putative dipeptidase PepE [Roseobacter fucihabitans]|uniref:Dipeptidase PepE n=1 Tax=Roseobacter fucihabitans TaxID=1537242 RepID=A0ABZ2BUH8_9RHOB|nr:Xaa-Pro peptidase family protein [Roseobacter litoralis]MBC6966643.1 putative peptidase [Roseobacter litoralis]
MSPKPRGFPEAEFRQRLQAAQERMGVVGLDALFLSTEPEVRYFTGFLTRFWESPTRPWFLLLPQSGDPIAVIPSIGAHLMAQSWITDIRTWRAPDYDDDGVTLLVDTIAECLPAKARIGVPSGLESHLRMPLASWDALRGAIGARRMVSDHAILRDLRAVKSDYEIAKIREACTIADRSFARIGEIAQTGVPLADVFRQFQILCLEEGADWVGYLAGGAGPGGYGDVITPAVARPLCPGDVLMLDTGVVHDGYYCDFDRNFAIGTVDRAVDDAYARLLEASDQAFTCARPGVTASELFQRMDVIVTGGAGGSDAGRLGHGLGMQLTEWPSLIPADETVLKAGMVLTLEPGIEINPGQTLVHEENIVITATGAEYLSTPAPRNLPRLA